MTCWVMLLGDYWVNLKGNLYLHLAWPLLLDNVFVLASDVVSILLASILPANSVECGCILRPCPATSVMFCRGISSMV